MLELTPTHVRVTTDHIELGERESCERCPIALAILDAIGIPGLNVAVDADEITLYLRGDEWRAEPPSAAGDFVVRFDDDEAVTPFEFELTWTELGPEVTR